MIQNRVRNQDRSIKNKVIRFLSLRLQSMTRLLMMVTMFVICLMTNITHAEDSRSPSSSRLTKNEAVRAIPFDKLDRASKIKANSVLDDISIFRKMPVEYFKCDSEFYLYCVNRPDSVVNIWEVLGISEVGLKQTGRNTYTADDGHGTKSKFEYLHRSYDKHLIYAEGSYMGSIFSKKVSGKALLLLRTGYLKQKNGETFIVHRLDVFISLDNVGIDLLARTFQPLVGKMADRNFTEVSLFVEKLHKKVESDPSWSQQMTLMLGNVHPKTRTEFSEISSKLAVELSSRKTITASSKKSPSRTVSRTTSSGQAKGREASQKRSSNQSIKR